MTKRVTQSMVDRGVEAIHKLLHAAAPEEVRLDHMHKVVEIPFGEVTLEALSRAVLRAGLNSGVSPKNKTDS